MSAATIAFWADSGSIIRDTLDTCVVQVQKNGAFNTYTIDMQRGVIVSMTSSSNQGFAVHQYFYGHENGIYFLTKVTFGPDTTIQSYGGYEFINIRVNGEQFASTIPFPEKPRGRDLRPSEKLTNGTVVSIYDLLGRKVVGSGLVGQIDQACRSGGCSSGSYFLKVEKRNVAGSTVIISR